MQTPGQWMADGGQLPEELDLMTFLYFHKYFQCHIYYYIFKKIKVLTLAFSIIACSDMSSLMLFKECSLNSSAHKGRTWMSEKLERETSAISQASVPFLINKAVRRVNLPLSYKKLISNE